MIVVRHAISDPSKTAERKRLLEDHKTYLRTAPFRILLSGPSVPRADTENATALVIAVVDAITSFEDFSAADPFVRAGVYRGVEIFEWTPTVGALLEFI